MSQKVPIKVDLGNEPDVLTRLLSLRMRLAGLKEALGLNGYWVVRERPDPQIVSGPHESRRAAFIDAVLVVKENRGNIYKVKSTQQLRDEGSCSV